MAGVIAWGVGCGEEDIPGVYAAVTDGLCFIDWATKCKHGDKFNQFYDYSAQLVVCDYQEIQKWRRYDPSLSDTINQQQKQHGGGNV